LIHGEWFQPGHEGPEIVSKNIGDSDSDNGLADKAGSVTGQMKKYLLQAKDLHDSIGQYSHPRTIQLFSSGGHATISEVCWRARDITQVILNALPRQRQAGTHLSHYDSQSSLHPGSLLGEIKEAKPLGFGKYSEIRWRQTNGQLGEIVPPETRLADLLEPLTTGAMRLYQLWMTASKETVPGMTDDPVCHLGDGTVPVSSATAMEPDLSGWSPCIRPLPTWQSPTGEEKYATGLANEASHDQFYNDEKAISGVKQTIFNLCLGWLKGDFA
jgi:hypothetical protein